MSDSGEKPNGKQYERPQVTVINLRPEEAVLGNCKSMSVSGPGQMNTCANLGGCTPVGS